MVHSVVVCSRDEFERRVTGHDRGTLPDAGNRPIVLDSVDITHKINPRRRLDDISQHTHLMK